MQQPLVSVVIPTFARPRALRECLDALAHQTMPKTDFEVVVVDDGSPGSLADVVAEAAPRLAARLVRQENAGPAAARNRGVREALGPLVAFTDDDCRPSPCWLERLVAAERERPGTLVGGSTVNGLPNDLFAATSQLIVDMVYEHFNADPEHAYFLTSNNIVCSRARLLTIGGFDERFRLAAEDRDFCDRWRAAGFGIAWRPDATIEHRHAQTLGTFVGLHYRYGRGAHMYKVKRSVRGTGTMQEDIGFHATLPRRLWGRLGRELAYGRAVPIGSALVLWQVANAVGFAVQAWVGRGEKAGPSPELPHTADD
jgi:GT2 family glycosyltransferase